jgi:hypothetical protein
MSSAMREAGLGSISVQERVYRAVVGGVNAPGLRSKVGDDAAHRDANLSPR